MLEVYPGFNVLCSSGNFTVAEVIGGTQRLSGLQPEE